MTRRAGGVAVAVRGNLSCVRVTCDCAPHKNPPPDFPSGACIQVFLRCPYITYGVRAAATTSTDREMESVAAPSKSGIKGLHPWTVRSQSAREGGGVASVSRPVTSSREAAETAPGLHVPHATGQAWRALTPSVSVALHRLGFAAT